MFYNKIMDIGNFIHNFKFIGYLLLLSNTPS